MIVRIVQLKIEPEDIDDALGLISEVAPKVRGMSGCTYLEILRDVKNQNNVTTYSHWNSELDLNTYRHSEVFKAFWSKIKPLFSEPAGAWSSERIEMHE